MTDSIEIQKVADRAGFTSSEYNAIAVSAKLRAISLLSNEFHFDPDPKFDRDGWKLGYGVRVNSCKYDDEQCYVAAIIRYTMTAKAGRKNAIRCAAEYGVFYDVGSVENAEAAEAFCNNVGVFAAYPYFRALVSNLLWGAGVDLPPLPAIASTAHIPKKAKKDA